MFSAPLTGLDNTSPNLSNIRLYAVCVDKLDTVCKIILLALFSSPNSFNISGGNSLPVAINLSLSNCSLDILVSICIGSLLSVFAVLNMLLIISLATCSLAAVFDIPSLFAISLTISSTSKLFIFLTKLTASLNTLEFSGTE